MTTPGRNDKALVIRKKDRRSLCTESAIKDALLREISETSYGNANISSICRRAKITRPTFYLHFDNLSQVLDQLIENVAQEVDDIAADLCDKCGSTNAAAALRSGSSQHGDKIPFCQLVLGEGKYAPLFRDDYIAGRVIERIVEISEQASIDAGLPAEDAKKKRILNLFRMNGCMAAAKSFGRSGGDWSEAASLIDRFVASGFSAVFHEGQNE